MRQCVREPCTHARERAVPVIAFSLLLQLTRGRWVGPCVRHVLHVCAWTPPRLDAGSEISFSLALRAALPATDCAVWVTQRCEDRAQRRKKWKVGVRRTQKAADTLLGFWVSVYRL